MDAVLILMLPSHLKRCSLVLMLEDAGQAVLIDSDAASPTPDRVVEGPSEDARGKSRRDVCESRFGKKGPWTVVDPSFVLLPLWGRLDDGKACIVCRICELCNRGRVTGLTLVPQW